MGEGCRRGSRRPDEEVSAPLLHVPRKGLSPSAEDSFATHDDAKVTELGRGSIDYWLIFAQASENQKISHAFIEQEEFDMPWKESLKVDAEYMKNLTI